jgi:hypothetical protein
MATRVTTKMEVRMDNQHRQIKGYRELDAEDIALLNEAKEIAAVVGEFCGKRAAQPAIPPDGVLTPGAIDKRWLAIGQTNLQQGFMAVNRSITRPGFFG